MRKITTAKQREASCCSSQICESRLLVAYLCLWEQQLLSVGLEARSESGIGHSKGVRGCSNAADAGAELLLTSVLQCDLSHHALHDWFLSQILTLLSLRNDSLIAELMKTWGLKYQGKCLQYVPAPCFPESSADQEELSVPQRERKEVNFSAWHWSI